MRIDKLLGNMGFGSRKDVKILIRKGHVTVNGQVIRNSGTIVDPELDLIFVKNTRVHYRKHIYIMLNKPQEVISANEDKYDQTVIGLLTDDLQHFKPFSLVILVIVIEGLLFL